MQLITFKISKTKCPQKLSEYEEVQRAFKSRTFHILGLELLLLFVMAISGMAMMEFSKL